MKLINRGFLLAKPKTAFIEWATQIDPELMMDENSEGSLYLIEEELNKSELIREMIDKYVRSCRNPQKKDVVQEITKIKGRNTITPKNIN